MDKRQANEVTEPANGDLDAVDRLLVEKKAAPGAAAIAILALLVSVSAVLATGWHWWQTRQDETSLAAQQHDLSNLREAQQQLAASLAAIEEDLGAAPASVDAAEVARLAERLGAAEARLDSLRGEADGRQAAIGSLQGTLRSIETRLGAAESGLLSVAAGSQRSSTELDLAEIDFLLRTATERLQLFADPTAADLALQAADVQLEALNDPMFLSVRQRIASARRALAEMPVLDRVGLASRISALQTDIPGLPLRGEAGAPAETPPAAGPGWWGRFKQALSSLVTVRRRVAGDPPVLSLADEDYLRQGLWLQLESARLALMRGDGRVYDDALGRAEATIGQFFDGASPAAQELLSGLAALRGLQLAAVMPDISGPWTQFRQLRDSRRLLQSATPVEKPDPAE